MLQPIAFKKVKPSKTIHRKIRETFGDRSSRWKQRMSRGSNVGEMRGIDCERWEEVNRLRAEMGRELLFRFEWETEQELMPKRVHFNCETVMMVSRWVRTGVVC